MINPIAGKTDYQQSIELLNEVNALNNPVILLLQFCLVIYLDGKGVAKDEKQAQQWFDKANEMTYPGYAEWMGCV
ncbi:sel1 repeat family protein [Providencia rettgeri]|uniref:Sel1 repeat family protein n=1 Tax=Providencia rettgeri TaxID=587 RepID=A0A939NBL0_PRORE|nr:sel1 repeat family protein [Providencia rettgeri]